MAEDTREVGRTRAVGLLADVVRWAGLAAAVVLVLHVLLVAGEANPANGIARFINDLADLADLASLGFKDLFTPEDAKLRVLVNYGIAALFWLALSTFLSRLIRRLA
jgi:hypothetical protein